MKIHTDRICIDEYDFDINTMVAIGLNELNVTVMGYPGVYDLNIAIRTT